MGNYIVNSGKGSGSSRSGSGYDAVADKMLSLVGADIAAGMYPYGYTGNPGDLSNVDSSMNPGITRVSARGASGGVLPPGARIETTRFGHVVIYPDGSRTMYSGDVEYLPREINEALHKDVLARYFNLKNKQELAEYNNRVEFERRQSIIDQKYPLDDLLTSDSIHPAYQAVNQMGYASHDVAHTSLELIGNPDAAREVWYEMNSARIRGEESAYLNALGLNNERVIQLAIENSDGGEINFQTFGEALSLDVDVRAGQLYELTGWMNSELFGRTSELTSKQSTIAKFFLGASPESIQRLGNADTSVGEDIASIFVIPDILVSGREAIRMGIKDRQLVDALQEYGFITGAQRDAKQESISNNLMWLGATVIVPEALGAFGKSARVAGNEVDAAASMGRRLDDLSALRHLDEGVSAGGALRAMLRGKQIFPGNLIDVTGKSRIFTGRTTWQAPVNGTGFEYKVFQRNDIDWDFTTSYGKTNLDLALSGKPPLIQVGDEYLPVHLHHSRQDARGPIFEVNAVTHLQLTNDTGKLALHPYPSGHPNYPVKDVRQVFDNVDRPEYWIWRANEVKRARGIK